MSISRREELQKRVAESTLRNYYKPIKLFCEMNDIVLSWKKISKGLPRARSASTDRAPTIEEIRTILNYPDRRISIHLIPSATKSAINLFPFFKISLVSRNCYNFRSVFFSINGITLFSITSITLKFKSNESKR